MNNLNDLENLKIQRDFQESIHNSIKLIKKDTRSIPTLEELNEELKGEFTEHDDFTQAFDGLLSYCNEHEEFDDGSLDWNSVNYNILGSDYYKEKFPGFSDEVYEILAESTETKFVDETEKGLVVEKVDKTISFD